MPIEVPIARDDYLQLLVLGIVLIAGARAVCS